MSSPDPAPRRPADVLRVASYNVRDLKDDVAAAARVVRAIAPDVLCLQEVPRHPLSGHRVADFAAACGMLFSGGHQHGGGTAIFTSLRTAVATAEHRRLPVRRFARPRGYALSEIALPGHLAVQVVSAHLSLDPQERVRHAASVLQAVGGRATPVILGGDLNETEDGPAWQCLSRRLSTVTGPAPTFPAVAPRRRIDAVLASPELTPAGADGVDGAGGAVELPDGDLQAATDHLPVWADLLLPGAS